jgi:hypothetical protein
MAYGGYTGSPAYTANAETWNGSAWTEVSNLSDLKGILGGGGASNTDQLAFGGYGGSPESARFATTEFWNGSSWTELADLSVARSTKHSLPSAPTANQLYAGGHTPPANYVTITEEWSTTPASEFSKITEGQLYFNSTANAFKETITDMAGATWASGTNFPSALYGITGFGAQDAAMMAAGPIATSESFTYNGSAWTEQPGMNTASPSTSRYFPGGFGTTTAGVVAGGEPLQAFTETWDGSSWTEVNDMNQGRTFNKAVGTYTAGLTAGGQSPIKGNVELWDGTNWTETTDLNTARNGTYGGGTQTSAVIAGGSTPTDVTNSETWNGSSWTEVSEMNTARAMGGSAGTVVTAVLAYGGPGNAQTEFWNGSSWTEVNDLSTSRRSYGNAGTAGAALFTTGEPPTTAATEEFTASLANKTITAS